ncbi:MAG TPA: hypothetical protein VGL09_06610 [Methylomirabilota bacterium]
MFFPNIGMTTPAEPTQGEVDYAWAFFNLMRKGDLQVFSRATKDGAGNWVPRRYPEMDIPLGTPTEVAAEQSPNLWRRHFTGAIAYVNLGDGPVNVTLPAAGAPYRNSRGQTVASPLTLASFSGLTVYKAAMAPTAPSAPIVR